MGLEYLWILLAVSALFSAIGFYKYVYFISLGYVAAVAGIGIALTIMSLMGIFPADLQDYLLFLLLLLYGLRLSGFLLIREVKSAAYRKTLSDEAGGEKQMPLLSKAAIWVCVSLLYVAQTSPVFFRLLAGGNTTWTGWVGILLCFAGLVLEATADRQKSKQKHAHPDRVAMEGLYKFVRCPNYFGEILFWTGIFVSGIANYQGPGQWLTAAAGYIVIVFVMFNGAQRLEKRQMQRYGSDPAYNAYAGKTPILLPLIPLYHLNKQAEAAPKGKANRRERRRIIAVLLIGTVLLLGGGGVLYVNDYYRASPNALAALKSAQKLENGYYAFGQESAQAGLIFYPGGKVDAAAYAPLMQALAERGLLCILTSMPLRLAVLNVNAANGLQEMYPNIKEWYIGGHSLGGSMAAVYAAGHTEDFQGLILLAAYSTADVSASGLRVLTLYGSEDGVLNQAQLDKNAKHLPSSAKTILIEGGCHAYFGDYDMQKGDGMPAITREEQQQRTANAIWEFAVHK